jgi:hypothetical protein
VTPAVHVSTFAALLPQNEALGPDGPAGDTPYILKSMPRAGTDHSRTRAELGVSPPPLHNTLCDTVAWLVAAGHLSAKAAGRLGVP